MNDEQARELGTRSKGLTPEEVAELMQYISKNNSWEHLHECSERGRKVPKYIDMYMDSRFGEVWCIKFRDIVCGGYTGPDEVIFRTERGYELKAKIYEWLDGEKVEQQ